MLIDGKLPAEVRRPPRREYSVRSGGHKYARIAERTVAINLIPLDCVRTRRDWFSNVHSTHLRNVDDLQLWQSCHTYIRKASSPKEVMAIGATITEVLAEASVTCAADSL